MRWQLFNHDNACHHYYVMNEQEQPRTYDAVNIEPGEMINRKRKRVAILTFSSVLGSLWPLRSSCLPFATAPHMTLECYQMPCYSLVSTYQEAGPTRRRESRKGVTAQHSKMRPLCSSCLLAFARFDGCAGLGFR